MSSLRQSPLPTLQALSRSFTDLTTVLEPLLTHKYESLNLALQSNSSSASSSSSSDGGESDELRGRLDAARMQVSVAYVLMDLVWILLKTKGVDPTSHPVLQELERVKSYFTKIKRVQEKQKDEDSEEGRSKLDKSAAGRFIRAALSSEANPTGTHTKFDEEGDEQQEAAKNADTSSKEGKKASESVIETSETPIKTPQTSSSRSSSKKKRPTMDPFQGYSADTAKSDSATPTKRAKKTDSAAADTGSTSSSPTKKKKKSTK